MILKNNKKNNNNNELDQQDQASSSRRDNIRPSRNYDSIESVATIPPLNATKQTITIPPWFFKLGKCIKCLALKDRIMKAIRFGKGTDISLCIEPNFANCMCCNGRGGSSRLSLKDSEYFIYNPHSGMLRSTSKDEFKNFKGDFLNIDGSKIKCVSDYFQDKISMRRELTQALRPYVIQIFPQFSIPTFNFSDVFKNILNSFKSKCNNIMKGYSYFKIISELADNPILKDTIISLSLSFYQLYSFGFTRLPNFTTELLQLVCILYDIYLKIKILTGGSSTLQESSWNIRNCFSQGGDSICYSILFQALPSTIQKIIRDIHLFTNGKLCDDTILFCNAFFSISKIIMTMFDTFKSPALSKFIAQILEFTPFSQLRYFLIASELYIEKSNNPRFCSSPLAIEVFQPFFVKFRQYMSTPCLERKTAITIAFNKCMEIQKRIDAYVQSSRQEPVAFVFEGPAGTGKSESINLLTSVLGRPVYTHTTIDVNRGKDFWDSYNNEEIVVMDDVGSQGASEFGNFVSLISPTRMQLQCAEAKLKGTKYFTSKVLLINSNHFQDLRPLMSDGISDIGALYRRFYIFDYSDVLGDGRSAPKGPVHFKYYDIKIDKFVHGFPPALGITLPKTHLIDDVVSFIIWTKQIVERIENHNQIKQQESQVRTQKIKQRLNELSNTTQTSIGDIIQKLMDFGDDFVEKARLVTDEIIKCLVMFCEKGSKNKILAFGTLIGVGGLAYSLCHFGKGKQKMTQTLISNLQPYCDEHREDVSILSPGNFKLANFNVKYCKIEGSIKGVQKIVESVCVVTSHFILIPGHSRSVLPNENMVTATVYQDSQGSVLYDHVKIRHSTFMSSVDLLILELDSYLPQYAKSITPLLSYTHKSEAYALVAPNSVLPINKESDKHQITADTNFTYKDKNGKVYSIGGNYLAYDLTKDGLCMSLLVSRTGKIMGHHIAGDSIGGVSVLYTPGMINEINKIITSKRETHFKSDVAPTKLPGMSIVKLNEIATGVTIPTKTTYKESEIYGIFPETRIPVNMQPHGKGTVKEQAKKSYTPVQDLNNDGINFAVSYLRRIIPTYNNVSEAIVVNGNGVISKLNNKSSSGYHFLQDKKKYIDYENSCYTEEFKQYILKMKQELINGTLDTEKLMYIETLKDELRDVAKVNDPRCFKAAPLGLTVIYKELLADCFAQIHSKRLVNGIFIGCNPHKDFEKLYRIIAHSSRNVFDGDIKKWDGSMPTQVMESICDVLLEKYQGKDRILLKQVLYLTFNTVTANMNEVLVTTHSMPSGCYLTADFNSLVNKFYSAYIYYIIYKDTEKCNLNDYLKNIYYATYGDDFLAAVHSSCPEFNALSYCNILSEMGLGLTTAEKIKHTEPYTQLDKLQFLKRSFKFHKQLKRIVGVLCPKSRNGTLNYISDKKREDEILPQKIDNFYRELFLDEESWVEDSSYVEDYCLSRGLVIPPRSNEEMIEMYENDTLILKEYTY